MKQITAQEAFTTIEKHLLTQMAKSSKPVNGGTMCAYRGDNGLKCAAGCLILDEEYKDYYEGALWLKLPTEVLSRFTDDANRLIETAQSIHDSYYVHLWRELLNSLATKFGVKTSC